MDSSLKKRWPLLLLALPTFAGCGSAPAPVAEIQVPTGLAGATGAHTTSSDVRAHTVLVRLKSPGLEHSKAFDSALRNLHLQVSKRSPGGMLTLSAINEVGLQPEAEVVRQLQDNPVVRWAETDRLVPPAGMTNDPKARFQWHHALVNTIDAWETTTGSPEITVADCDTGFESLHPDLRGNFAPGYNSEDTTSTIDPVHPHGTQTAGLIVARANNGLGIAGIAGTARLLPIRVTNLESGAAYLSALTACIEYAADHDVRVVNLPYAVADSPAVALASEYLKRKRGLLVVAAGNEGKRLTEEREHPSSMIVVGAMGHEDQRDSLSNYGSAIDLLAPGVDMLTTGTGSSYVPVNGTSYSASVVSGIAALVLSAYPDLTPSQLRSILFRSAMKVQPAGENGRGLIDANAAVSQALKLKPKPKKVEKKASKLAGKKKKGKKEKPSKSASKKSKPKRKPARR